MDILVLNDTKKEGNHMKNKKKPISNDNLDNNKDVKELLRENKNKEEIASEISNNKKIADILGNRLANKNFFPPC